MGFRVDGSPVDRVRLDVVAIAAADVEPVVGVDATGSRHRGAAGCSGILQSAVDEVRIAIVDSDCVVLRRIDVLEGLPGLTAIVGEIKPTIVALPESLLGVWIEPDRMPAVATSTETLEGGAPVLGIGEADVEVIGELVVERTDGEMLVIEGSTEIAVLVGPGGATILRAIDARTEFGHVLVIGIVAPQLEAVFVVRHQDLWIAPRDGQTDLAGFAFGQPFGEFAETRPSIGGLEDAAVGSATIEAVGSAPAFPECDDDRFGVPRVHHRLAGTGAPVRWQSALEFGPVFSTVGGFEETAVSDLSPDATECRNVGDLRVGRMGQDRADGIGVGETHVSEGLSAIDRFVDSVAPRR